MLHRPTTWCEVTPFDMPRKDKTVRQKAAESEVDSYRRDCGPFVVAAESTRMAMVFTDAKEPGDPIIFANDSFLSLTGYAREEALGQRFDFLMSLSADPTALAFVETGLSGHLKCDLDICCRRKDGGMFWAAVLIDPVRDKAGEVVQHFASFVDLTKHKEEEERLRGLLDELNHRTQNTLATVQSIAVQTLRGVADDAVVDLFVERILALSKAHGLLGRENWEAVGLRELIDQTLQPFGLKDGSVSRFSVEGVDVRLQPKAVLTLAMVFHELATNAAKHGALSNGARGTVAITWRVEPHPHCDRLRLEWRESGCPPVARPGRNGFGSRLIEGALARDLGGEVHVSYETAGVACQIVMPLRPRQVSEHA
jgi:PAS domain S-box-containing protein